MALSEVSKSPNYVLSGVGPYEIPFKFLEDSHVVAYIDGELYEGTFSVTGEGSDDGGQLTFANDPGEGTLVIIREVPFDQTFSYEEGDSLPPKNLENNIDRTVMQVQQIREALERAPVLKPGVTVDDKRATTIGYDENGNPIARTKEEQLSALGIGQNYALQKLNDATWKRTLTGSAHVLTVTNNQSGEFKLSLVEGIVGTSAEDLAEKLATWINDVLSLPSTGWTGLTGVSAVAYESDLSVTVEAESGGDISLLLSGIDSESERVTPKYGVAFETDYVPTTGKELSPIEKKNALTSLGLPSGFEYSIDSDLTLTDEHNLGRIFVSDDSIITIPEGLSSSFSVEIFIVENDATVTFNALGTVSVTGALAFTAKGASTFLRATGLNEFSSISRTELEEVTVEAGDGVEVIKENSNYKVSVLNPFNPNLLALSSEAQAYYRLTFCGTDQILQLHDVIEMLKGNSDAASLSGASWTTLSGDRWTNLKALWIMGDLYNSKTVDILRDLRGLNDAEKDPSANFFGRFDDYYRIVNSTAALTTSAVLTSGEYSVLSAMEMADTTPNNDHNSYHFLTQYGDSQPGRCYYLHRSAGSSSLRTWRDGGGVVESGQDDGHLVGEPDGSEWMSVSVIQDSSNLVLKVDGNTQSAVSSPSAIYNTPTRIGDLSDSASFASRWIGMWAEDVGEEDTIHANMKSILGYTGP